MTPAVKNIQRIAPLAEAAAQKYQSGRAISKLVGEPTLTVLYTALKQGVGLKTSGARVTPMVKQVGQALDVGIDTTVHKVDLAKDVARSTVKTPFDVPSFFKTFLLG